VSKHGERAGEQTQRRLGLLLHAWRGIRSGDERLSRLSPYLLTPAVVAVNYLSGMVLVGYFVLLARGRDYAGDVADQILLNLVLLAGYAVVGFAIGYAWVSRSLRKTLAWLVEERAPTDQEIEATLRHPMHQALIPALIWFGAFPVFFGINLAFSARLALDIGAVVLIGALSNAALAYLLAEWMLRPVTTLAFAGRRPNATVRTPSLNTRVLVAWGLGTGLPLVGVAIALVPLPGDDNPPSRWSLTVLVVGALAFGAVALRLAVGSIADPVRSVTRALAEVEQGRLEVEVPVYDASEIGQLQSGFNAMVEGLRERRLLADLYGRQVGEGVARQALEQGAELGGEVVEAAVLFVDVIGSTRLAAKSTPEEVVAALNEVFGVVVTVVGRYGGFVNKFEGDAALCVFGAPIPLVDPHGAALAAAREMRTRLSVLEGLDAAIGVSAGKVLAGNIGAAERFEYTVIGDPVNEAARLTEVAKSRRGRLVASALVIAQADASEAALWRPAGRRFLRGRRDPTPLAEPAAT
jgi:adenylate cyclase